MTSSRLTGGLALWIVTFFAGSSHGQCAYDVLIFEHPPQWAAISPAALSDDGTVVGIYGLERDPRYFGFKWHPTTGFHALPMPPTGKEVTPQAISSNGIIAGQCKVTGLPPQSGSLMQMVIWNGPGPGYTPPPTSPPNHAQVTGVDATGRVCGFYSSGPLSGKSFQWRDGEYLPDIPQLKGVFSAQLFCVTDNEWMSGRWALDSSLEVQAGFIASLEGDYIEIPAPEGYIVPQFKHLTQKLHGVLHCKIPPSPRSSFGLPRAFFWDGTLLTPLGLPPDTDTNGVGGVNSVDQLVGFARKLYPSPEQPVPILWQNGSMMILSDLFVMPAGMKFNGALDINESGVILGWGAKLDGNITVGVLLTPLTVDEDINLDCSIDVRDLQHVLEEWGPITTSSIARADIDKSGIVDGADLAMVLGAWAPK